MELLGYSRHLLVAKSERSQRDHPPGLEQSEMHLQTAAGSAVRALGA